jgi:small subunit ribosomal protein S20
MVKHFEATVGQGDANAASEQFHVIARKLDQTASTSTMHKRTVARKKSRLAKRLNALKAKPTTPA